jgi:hypothetical protein
MTCRLEVAQIVAQIELAVVAVQQYTQKGMRCTRILRQLACKEHPIHNFQVGHVVGKLIGIHRTTAAASTSTRTSFSPFE